MDKTTKALMDLSNATPNQMAEELKQSLLEFAQQFAGAPPKPVVQVSPVITEAVTQFTTPSLKNAGSVASGGTPGAPTIVSGTKDIYCVFNGGYTLVRFQAEVIG